MLEENNKYIDGHADVTASDMGSWVCTKVTIDQTYHKFQIREYSGLSSDIGKLPVYDDLATGSTAFCVDNGTVLIFDSSTKSWNAL